MAVKAQHHLGLWERAAFGPLAAIPAFIGSFLGPAAGAAGASGSILGGAGSLLSSGATIASVLRAPPKAPAIPAAPTPPTFFSAPTGGTNASLAAQSPGLALGGTAGVLGGAPSGGGNSLLGQ